MHHKVKATLAFLHPDLHSRGAEYWLAGCSNPPERNAPRSTAQYFDIGIAGPLAGFVAAIIILIYGFPNASTPQSSYLLPINPDYVEVFGRVPSETELNNWIEQGGYFNLLVV